MQKAYLNNAKKRKLHGKIHIKILGDSHFENSCKKIVIHSQLEHHHTNPNESKCIRYKRIGPRLCESVNQERKRGMPHRCREEGAARTAIEGAETLTLLELAE